MIVTPIRGSGPGGQNKNKNFTGRRISHSDSGVTVESTDNKSSEQNKKSAFKKLVNHPRFKLWYQQKIWEIVQKEQHEKVINERVIRQMYPENLLIETFENGEWIES